MAGEKTQDNRGTRETAVFERTRLIRRWIATPPAMRELVVMQVVGLEVIVINIKAA